MSCCGAHILCHALLDLQIRCVEELVDIAINLMHLIELVITHIFSMHTGPTMAVDTDAACRELQLATATMLSIAYMSDWKVAMLAAVATGYMAFVAHLVLEPDENVGHRAGAEGYDGGHSQPPETPP